MRVRYLIERGNDDDVVRGRPFALGLVDRNGDDVMKATPIGSIEDCKALAEQSEPDLKWKDAPRDWQPDVVLVSSFFEDEGWDNRG